LQLVLKRVFITNHGNPALSRFVGKKEELLISLIEVCWSFMAWFLRNSNKYETRRFQQWNRGYIGR